MSFHPQARGQTSQRVYLATQLFSARVAAFVRLFLPQFAAEAAAIEKMDKLFDVLNSSSAFDVKVERRGFGATPEAEAVQRQALAEGAELIRGAVKVTPERSSAQPPLKRRRTGPPRKLPFQRGFLRNIQSVIGVLEDVRKFGLKYVLTSHLNQDLVENLFSQIRAMCGAENNPTAVGAQMRLRMLLILAQPLMAASSRSPAIPVRMPRTAQSDSTQYLTGRALHRRAPSGSSAAAVPPGSGAAVVTPSSGAAVVTPSPGAAVVTPGSGAAVANPATCPDTASTATIPATRQAVSLDNTKDLDEDAAEEEEELLTATFSEAVGRGPPPPIVLDEDERDEVELGSVGEELRSQAEEAFSFVAGYVASKCRSVDATLGLPTDSGDAGAQYASVPATWIRALSCGSLTVPSEQWLQDCRELEVAFCAAMGRRYYPHPGVKRYLLEQLKMKGVGRADSVLKKFVSTRMWIRIRLLNENRAAEVARRRALKQLRQHAQ